MHLTSRPLPGQEGVLAMSTTLVARDTLAPAAPKLRVRIGRRTALLLALGMALTLGGARYGYDWRTVGRFIETTDDAYAGGNVTAISPHVAGFVAEIAVADNQYVHAGQLLIRLDSRDYAAALDHAQAIADGRVAALRSLEAKYVLQQ